MAVQRDLDLCVALQRLGDDPNDPNEHESV